MSDREKIFRAIMDHRRFESLLFDLSRDCAESCVIDQAIGLYERERKLWGVATGLVGALHAYPREKWTLDELATVASLILKRDWWVGLVDEFAEMWTTECERIAA